MPQARLPDINTAFIKHRNEVISSLKSQNYESVFGSLYALNALLPDTVYTKDENEELAGKPKYRVVISDIEYGKLAKPTIRLFCYHCDDVQDGFLYESVRMFNRLLTFSEAVITRRKYEKVWICPNCNKINKLDKTRRLDKIAETQLKEPYYLGVVPKPPKKQRGLLDRDKYNKHMKQWAETFLAELEARMAQFRDDNWNQGNKDIESAELGLDGGEMTDENY
jgi:hypothetical protein